MHYFDIISSAVTLKIEPWLLKVDISKILSMFTMYPNLKAIGQILYEIL